MKRFRKILAILPQEHESASLLEWTKVLAEASEAERVDFIQCLPAPLEVYPQAEEASSHDELREGFKSEVESSFQGLPFHIETLEEAPLKPVLHLLASGEFDLVAVAASDFDGRALAERLARKSPVGVLVIPGNMTLPPKRILAGLDFASLSELVVDWSQAFATLDPEGQCKLEALHLTRIPSSARATMALGPDALKKLVLETANDNLTSFLKEHARNPQDWEKTIISGYSFGQELSKVGHCEKGDLLVVGCQGRNALSVAVLGSQAAEIIRNSECPVLIVKQKNASLGFLRQLLGLGQ